MPSKVGRTFTGALEQVWPDVLPAATSDCKGNSRS